MLLRPSTDLAYDSSKETWKQELIDSYSSVSDLLRDSLVSKVEAQALEKLGSRFKVRITPYYSKLMDGSPECPIRKQAIPHLNENDPNLPPWATQLSEKIYARPTPWHADAIGDLKNLAAPRLTHRYQNRVIIHLSSMCAVYCRFCFRKSHLNHHENSLYEGSLDPTFEYIQNHPEIRELIFTGGDPLSVTDAVLNRLLQRISQSSQVKTVRFHSRMAVTLPSRFTSSLLEIFKQDWGFQIYLVSHFNHPRELSAEARSALKKLKQAGVSLLNQSVLLRDINASTLCLANLFQGLYEAGVIPFYLHHPDWTPGTFHFRTSIEEGRSLFKQLRGLVPGPALPDYVLDIPQGYGKASLLGDDIKIAQDLSTLSPADSQGILGRVYEIPTPETKIDGPDRLLYLDLFPTQAH